MNRRLAVALALTSFACHVHANPHLLYQSDNVTFTGGALLELQAATRIQNSKYQRKFLNGTTSSGASTQGAVKRIGITRNNPDLALLSSAGAYLGAKAQDKSGLEYGMQVGIFTNVQSGYLPVKDDYGRTYGYIQKSEWGRLEIGTKKSAGKNLAINADSIAAATGGIDGGWSNYLNLNTYDTARGYAVQAINDDNFLDGPKLLYKDNDTESNHEGNRKITYYTPRFSNGIKIGVSYIPDSSNKGSDDSDNMQKFPNKNGPIRRLKNLIVAALSWEHKINAKQKVKVALVGETGTLTSSINDTIANRRFYTHPKGYNVGIQYSYDKFDFVASYGNRGKWYKYQKQPGGIKDSQFYTAGLAYKFTDKISSSFTYFYSYNRNTLNLYSLGVEYKCLPGIKTYAEATYIQAKQKYNYAPTKSNSPINAVAVGNKTNFRNSGTVFIIGTKLSL